MSIKGIDAQIMLSRTPEASRDYAGQARRGELFQSQMAAHNKEQTAHDNKAVMRTEHVEQTNLHPEGGGTPNGGGGERQQKRKPPEESEDDLFVGLESEHKIDIKI